MLTLYGGMIRAGISMRDADETELGMYLKVLEQLAKADKDEDKDRKGDARKPVVELKRGFIDDFWG